MYLGATARILTYRLEYTASVYGYGLRLARQLPSPIGVSNQLLRDAPEALYAPWLRP